MHTRKLRQGGRGNTSKSLCVKQAAGVKQRECLREVVADINVSDTKKVRLGIQKKKQELLSQVEASYFEAVPVWSAKVKYEMVREGFESEMEGMIEWSTHAFTLCWEAARNIIGWQGKHERNP